MVIDDADKAIAADAKWVKGYLFKGVALERMGMLDPAIDVLDKGATVDPECTEIVHALDR